MNVTELIARLREDYCSCSEGYTSRQLIGPHCESCNTKDWRYDAADALEAQALEIAELRGDRDAAERGHDAAHAACVKYQDQVDALESRLAAAERDAERYRWLRENANYLEIDFVGDPDNRVIVWSHEKPFYGASLDDSVDAAIDAFLAKIKEGGK